MSPQARWRTCCVCLLLLIPLACGRQADDSALRLVDRLAELRITSALDLSDAGELARQDARVLLDGELAKLQDAAQHAGDWVGRLMLDGPARAAAQDAVLRVVNLSPLPAGEDLLVDVDLGRTLAAGEFLFAFARTDAVPPGVITSPAQIEPLLRNNRPFLRPLVADGGRPGHHGALIQQAGLKSLLIGAISRADGFARARVDVRALSERGALVLATAGRGSPWVRDVSAGAVTREALVIGAPGVIAGTFDLPRRDPRLRVAIAPLFGLMTSECQVAVVAACGGEELRVDRALRVGVDRGRWLDVDLDLGRFAGRSVELRLEATPRGAVGPGMLVAFGTPILDCAPLVGPGRPRDVILISLDTVRADRLAVYGGNAATSPQLAALAQDAVVFDQAISAAPWTLPSHVTIMSGQYPDRHGSHAPTSHIAATTPLLAESFRAAGYETIAYTGGGYVNPEFGFARGFERYGISDPAYPPPAWVEARGGPQTARQLAATVTATRADLLRCLDAPRHRPLFLFVHTYVAHNYAAPPDVLRALGAADADLPELLSGIVINEVTRLINDADAPAAAKERARWKTGLLYDAAVRVADDLVGDIVDRLRQTGRFDDTLLVVTSDHGEELLERGQIGHGQSLHEEQLHVPLIMHVPGLAAGRRADAVSLADLAPTLLELCGIDSPPGVADGRSLAGLLRHDTPLAPLPLLARGNRRDLVQRALRGERLKLIVKDLDEGGIDQTLYDLRADPGELTNALTDRPGEAARIQSTLFELVRDLKTRGVAGTTAELSGTVLEHLKELGYLNDG